jgi:hypothetical protein
MQVVPAYDDLAPGYNEHGYPSDLQREWVARVLGRGGWPPPEDWPLVLASLHRAIRPGGLCT